MAARRPLVVVGGRFQELPAADTLQDVPRWSFGTGDPLPVAGVQGDYYVGADNKLWQKGATTWTYTGVQYGSLVSVPSKTTPVDADVLSLGDSASGMQMSRITWANLRASLQFREKLSAARTYFVRTDGNDSNTGLSNTTGGAFASVQKAIDTVATLDLSIHQVTIQIGAGTYAGLNQLKNYSGAGPIVIQGDIANANAVVVTNATGHAFLAENLSSVYIVRSLKVGTTGGTGSGFYAQNSRLYIDRVNFGGCAGVHVLSADGSSVFMSGDYEISGGALAHWYASYGSNLITNLNQRITLSGTPAFVFAFAYAPALGGIRANTLTFVGAATGARYVSNKNSVIEVNAAGATYLPGNAAGTTDGFGVYG